MEQVVETQHAGFDFIKKAVDVVPELSFEQLLYLSRDEKFLKEMLQKTPTDLIIAKGIESIVPRLEQISTKKALYPKSPYATNNTNKDEAVTLLKEDAFYEECGPSAECIAGAYTLLCPLTLKELVHILGIDTVREMTFTLAQVRHLAQEQNHRRRTGPLCFKEVNYFLLVGRDNFIRLMSVWWRGNNLQSRSRWHYWFPKISNTDKLMKTDGTLICRHELR